MPYNHKNTIYTRFTLTFFTLFLSVSHVLAQDVGVFPTDLRGFKLGMSVDEGKALAKKLFGASIGKHCYRGWGGKDNVYTCHLTTLYGKHQDKSTQFIPKKSSFELGKEELENLELAFYSGKLYRIAGSWSVFEGDNVPNDLLHSFSVKFGNPQRTERVPTQTTKSDSSNPLSRFNYLWSGSGIILKVSIEAVEYPLASKNEGRAVIFNEAEFELVDEVTSAFVDKESKPSEEASRRQFIKNGLGL